MYENNSFDSLHCQKKIQSTNKRVPLIDNDDHSVLFYASNTPKYLAVDEEKRLIRIVRTLLKSNKGLLIIDESINLLAKRFQKLDLDNTEENRRLYRQLFFSCSEQLTQHISSVILSHEGFYQNDDHDKLFRDLLREQDIFTGIKADKGLVPLAGTDGEMTTQGLDGLAERCGQYFRDGARLMTWRCLYKIGREYPSDLSLSESSNTFARFASICQQHGLVPLLQPEIVSDGDYDLDLYQRTMEKILGSIYVALHKHYVFLEGTLLNIDMISSGMHCTSESTVDEVAQATLIALQRTVPPAVPGIYFSVDNQSLTSFISINQFSGRRPWHCAFSCGRKLQVDVLTKWNGKKENSSAAQDEFLKQIEIIDEQSKRGPSD